MKKITITPKLTIGDQQPLVFIAGPCVIESADSTLRLADRLKKVAEKHVLPLIFKASYDKANRSSIHSFRGPGIEKGCVILQRVKQETGLPILTDVHTIDEVALASQVADILQIPAFLCRQTDLIVAAAQAGRVINIKKGQFLAPWDIAQVIEKVVCAGNKNILITERGTSFGYNNLVVDMRAFPIMQRYGYPVIFDVTHSLQQPGGKGHMSGGTPEFIFPLARAAVAAGCNGVFFETHMNPSKARSDSATMLPFRQCEALMIQLKELHRCCKKTI